MAVGTLNAKDRERFARARVRGKTRTSDPSAVAGASYDIERDVFNLAFRSGGSMAIPRRLIPGLDQATNSALESVSISPAGDALSWRSIDVDVYVPGLIERTFGSRLLAAASGRRGGRRKSKAKAAAARMNGAKGGRPRRGRRA
ncbi:MAG: DUF2442 domain-containing protein [Blastocatellia bacterium]|nr:MAG: DUF2442 domain-containing protein [Blastocatellia bacterium]